MGSRERGGEHYDLTARIGGVDFRENSGSRAYDSGRVDMGYGSRADVALGRRDGYGGRPDSLLQGRSE